MLGTRWFVSYYLQSRTCLSVNDKKFVSRVTVGERCVTILVTAAKETEGIMAVVEKEPHLNGNFF